MSIFLLIIKSIHGAVRNHFLFENISHGLSGGNNCCFVQLIFILLNVLSRVVPWTLLCQIMNSSILLVKRYQKPALCAIFQYYTPPSLFQTISIKSNKVWIALFVLPAYGKCQRIYLAMNQLGDTAENASLTTFP